MTGNVATAFGIGSLIEIARSQSYNLAAKVIVPNIRYRHDVGASLIAGDLQQLVDWGYIDNLTLQFV